MKYKCLNNNIFKTEDYTLLPLREEDIYKIKEWRNAQINILRQKDLLTDESQKRYYNEIIKPTFYQLRPTQMLFSLLLKDQCIGYGGFVHISWPDNRSEISFLVAPERINNYDHYQNDFSSFLYLIKKIAFEDIKFNRIHGETYSFRKNHIQIMELNGFKREGILRQHIFVENEYHDSLIHSVLKNEYNEK